MRNIFIGLFAVLFIACSQKVEQKGFSIKGKIKNLGTNSISVQELTSKGLIFIDSSTVGADGSFELNGVVAEPTFCIIQTPKGAAVMVLDSNAEMILNINADEPEAFTVVGSPETEKLKQLLQVNNKYMELVKAIENKFASYGDQVPPVSVQNQIRQQYDSLMQARVTEMQQMILTIDNSLVPYFATNFLMPQADFEFFKQVDSRLYGKYTKSKYAQELHQKVERLAKTAIGSVAPDIVLQDPFGKTVSLSSLRGKIVLVDFWASWCKPCREESPNVVAAYNRFKSKGFEVFSVSLDDNREAWQKAINDDKLLWTHVSDLMKWNSSVVSLYNIDAIPFTLLVDGEGKILAKNLRGEALSKKLAEVLQ